LVIVTISAINIAHNFFMQVSERRREIGVLRAIGARQRDIRAIFLGEAALIGLVAGFFGILIAFLAGLAVDAIANAHLPHFPFKPETFFDFRWWIWAGGLTFSVVFCVLGGLVPSSRAARMQPAKALAAQ
jgi:ABC-type antimicrobial peptide transport system permease subunit